MAVTEGVRESDKCWRRHALWCCALIGLFLVLAAYFFTQNQARANENSQQNIQIVVIQTQLEAIRMSLTRIEGKLEREPKP